MQGSRWLLLLLFLALLLLAGLSMGIGSGSLADLQLRPIILRLRLLRLLAGIISGAGLAVAGVYLQGLFRNPLADPGIIGTSAGAHLGGLLAVWGGAALAPLLPLPLPLILMIPLGCLIGALLSLCVLLLVARRCPDNQAVLLCGVVMSMLYTSLAGGLLAWAQASGDTGRALNLFSLGGIDAKGAAQLSLALPLILAALAAGMAWWARPLDLLLSGEEEAASLGVDLSRLRRWTIIWASLAVAGAVAVAGSIAFIGLIVPHLLRPWLGYQHRLLFPAAALGGGLLLLLCDMVVRLLPGGQAIPLGVVSGLIGAPLFILILLRQRQGMFS